MRTIVNLNELDCGAELGTGFADTSLKQSGYAKFSPYFAGIFGLVFKGECRGPRYNFQIFVVRERMDYLFSQTITKIILILIGAHVQEWHNCDRFFRDLLRV